jgi:LysR family glycine cleavage system transcriptional activator
MKRGRLPLTALRSFEAAGRLSSFSRAAEELFVSQAAVSRQIRELESLLGKPLFTRLHRRVDLTDAGRQLLAQLTASFDAIDRELTAIRDAPPQSLVRVSAEPSFGRGWLVPRLNVFRDRRPDIDVAVDVDGRLIEFRSHEADLAIRHSTARTEWPRVQSRHLTDIAVTPVLAPTLPSSERPLARPADLTRYTLLHEENRNGWALWFAAAGVADLPPQRGPIFPDAALSTQAAILGHGVALGDVLLNGDDLRSGRLIRPFAIEVPYGSYWLVAPDFSALPEPASAFVEWLLAEVGKESLRHDEA